ncbi:hypothetical protein EJB05_47916, partial [Eragrostis curvula]
MSSVSVRKSSPAVIRPPEPAQAGTTIKLTCLDSAFVKVPPFTALLVFEEHLSRDATATIKGALSQALVHYSPFAGRISLSGADDGGGGGEGFSIRCTSEGVEFVAASADCGLEEAKIFDEYSYGSGGKPLLSVQVTEFFCGGLVVGVTWSHAVADGVGIAQFLAAVGELARGSPSPSVVPARWDEAVSGLPPLFNPVRQAMESSSPDDMELIVPLDVTVPWALINRIKADLVTCTSFEAVLAVLWWCRVRGTGTTTTTRPVYLTFAANVRRHVGAKDGYYGNCVVNQLVVAAVASAGVVDLVRMIRRAKDQLLSEKLIKEEEDDEGGRLMMRGLSGRYDVLLRVVLEECWVRAG